MERHFDLELKQLREKLFFMALFAQESISMAVDALLKRDTYLARDVIQREHRINEMEIEIDDNGRSMSALQRPVAHDLRVLGSIMKVTTDLERMGDHAVNIAERTIRLNEMPPIEKNLHLKEMSDAVLAMLRDGVRAFMDENVELANSVLQRDDLVDQYNDELYMELETLIQNDPLITRTGMNLVMVSHNLERIADLANNLAEDVIYMKQGREVRHHSS